MSTTSPQSRALAALGHDARLAIFRLLVMAGKDGLRVGDIGAHLGLAPSTLAHHLSTLVDAGLVRQDKQGREVINCVEFATMQGLLNFLTAECCAGVTRTDTARPDTALTDTARTDTARTDTAAETAA